MADTETTPNENGQEPNGGESVDTSAPEPNEGSDGQEQTTQDGANEGGLWDGIPEDHPVRQEVNKLREEAAAKRVASNQHKQESEELKEKLAEAKTSEEVQELVSDWQSKVTQAEVALNRERIGRRHQLPDELVELLKGDTEDALEEHAQKLKGLVTPSTPTPPAAPPRGGKSPGDDALDPRGAISAIKASRR